MTYVTYGYIRKIYGKGGEIHVIWIRTILSLLLSTACIRILWIKLCFRVFCRSPHIIVNYWRRLLLLQFLQTVKKFERGY
jgi:hypothetical protein